MKEIGKLLELLNEYDENWKIGKYGLYKHEEYEPMEEYIISKNFGFIKWLVENDKIDLLQLDNRIVLSEFNKVERVLMALSISDTPINDLISYLK